MTVITSALAIVATLEGALLLFFIWAALWLADQLDAERARRRGWEAEAKRKGR